MSTKNPRASESEPVDHRRTCARLEVRIRPGDDYSCPLTLPLTSCHCGAEPGPVLADEPVDGIEFTRGTEECLIDFVLADGEVVSKSGPSRRSPCLCDAFQRRRCVPKYGRIEDGWLHATTHVKSHEQIRPLVADLRALADRVVVDRLVVAEPDGHHDPVLFDRATLTEKQREAVEAAVERGYYSTESDVRLAEIADDLGISQSALSERLRTAQSKLITDLF
ncbi:helix-turn-helix domain-containing protein [Salinilacihabitans rarus]|uniref:helix-turn-helix domain-containing protein n=1 Tax=Salinilacihabitans rarus TaxID=2961596 RepID=UPI0020C84AAC|nr:helix-turn-helix domain-containing protein [Salinilacihabitans rarus]